ncbi:MULTISPECIES: N-acetylglucosaminyldiphosphoundecaprenol N-acetyl-beta-D-mannosaminyltransferase TarA [unclassified Staphylococcus]|uniref:N-acetylglucosaminyldiphosphoundecaprenol N-acetyl-beta-D-mannosaminyltransferase TarA n=1 Tax=unclassified Staphylococcus TaxID=91994 RepID=UPI0021D2EEA8|nr:MULTISPECIES: N-acetylglucosaminyldiphosphoundecaprenol N-acetyl-beta-D-mannosaminyltransferase TarA [unclassified Staphylococcus]UXR78656.1 WecB/TagA/CpsF family glycosyltransferase [Staphylococcus sp. IVB6227]UXR82816.1 WecB/TagA/CpsF family glycosyltransferase [Staphylococcus sp. IVB6214]
MHLSTPSTNQSTSTYQPYKPGAQVNILGVPFDPVTMSDMRQVILTYSRTRTTHNLFIVTANPEIVHYAAETPSYKKLIRNADYIIPDGTGVVKAAKWLGTPLPERVPGIEVMEKCLEIAQQEGLRVFLLGATDEVVKGAVLNIQNKYPNSEVKGHHGFAPLDDTSVVDEIRAFQPDFVFVGMGYPKQEQWIQQHRNHFEHTLMMGVGGSIDVFSGTVKRAPRIWRQLNLEWLYRILKDVKRIKRSHRIPKFVWAVLKQKMKK